MEENSLFLHGATSCSLFFMPTNTCICFAVMVVTNTIYGRLLFFVSIGILGIHNLQDLSRMYLFCDYLSRFPTNTNNVSIIEFRNLQ